jgi:type 1 glutamine amidotransferase
MLLRSLLLLPVGIFLLSAQPNQLRALLVTGLYDHGYQETAPCLREILEGTGHFDVRVTEDFNGATESTLQPYHVLIVLYNGPRWDAATERAVEKFVGAGKGMVTVHGATYAFNGVEVRGSGFKRTGILQPPWKEFVQMIGCEWPEEKLGHGRRHAFAVVFKDREHPILRGLPEQLEADDELYHRIDLLPQAKVLAVAFSDRESGGTGKDEPIMWSVNYDKGRVFHTTLGHDVKAMRAPAFSTTVARGAEWAATGEVK